MRDIAYKIFAYMNPRFFVLSSMIDIYPCMGLQEPGAELFHVGGLYHIETCPLIYRTNQWTHYYMIETSVMKELMS